MRDCDYVYDDALDNEQREHLREYVTPRRALDGSLVYLLDELDADALDALLSEQLDDDPEPPTPADPTPPKPADPRAIYRAQAASAADPLDRTVAQRQLVRLERAANRPVASVLPPCRWRHVPLGELFEVAGNRLHRRSDGRLESGHEPLHGSKSGRCVLIDPAAGRWWCRSCRRGGDAVTLVMQLRGWDHRRATAWLAARYGPSSDDGRKPDRARKRERWIGVRL
jgi:hypothetical protein